MRLHSSWNQTKICMKNLRRLDHDEKIVFTNTSEDWNRRLIVKQTRFEISRIDKHKLHKWKKSIKSRKVGSWLKFRCTEHRTVEVNDLSDDKQRKQESYSRKENEPENEAVLKEYKKKHTKNKLRKLCFCSL